MRHLHLFFIFASFSGAILLWMMLFLGTDDLSEQEKQELERWHQEQQEPQVTGQLVSSLRLVVFDSRSRRVAVRAEIADEPAEWAQGLMFRKSLARDRGMLFVFPAPRIAQFWMKNTFLPLDIIFISADRKVIGIRTAQPCKKDPCPFYASQAPAQYVLEVNAGFAARNSIRPGDRVILP